MAMDGAMISAAAQVSPQTVSAPQGSTPGGGASSLSGGDFSSLLQVSLSVSPATSSGVAQPVDAPVATAVSAVGEGTSGASPSYDALVAALSGSGRDISGMSAVDFLSALKDQPEAMQAVLAAAQETSTQDVAVSPPVSAAASATVPAETALAQLAAKTASSRVPPAAEAESDTNATTAVAVLSADKTALPQRTVTDGRTTTTATTATTTQPAVTTAGVSPDNVSVLPQYAEAAVEAQGFGSATTGIVAKTPVDANAAATVTDQSAVAAGDRPLTVSTIDDMIGKAEKTLKNAKATASKQTDAKQTTLTEEDVSAHVSGETNASATADTEATLPKVRLTSAANTATASTASTLSTLAESSAQTAFVTASDVGGKLTQAQVAGAKTLGAASASQSAVTWNTQDATQLKAFADELGARITTGAQQIKISMTPENLGDMTVSVKMDDAQGITLNVTVDTAQAKTLVEQNVSSLQTSLGEGGLKLASLDVNVRDQNQPSNASQNTADSDGGSGSGKQTRESAFQRQERERQERTRDIAVRMQYAGALRGINFLA